MDRAALDVALELGLPCGGWCPRGRRSEDGAIPEHYPLKETASRNYEERTTANVRDSDATLILCVGRPRAESGTAFTIAVARDAGRPVFVADPADFSPLLVDAVRGWMATQNVQTLNVAGPRESQSPGIGLLAGEFLREVLRASLIQR